MQAMRVATDLMTVLDQRMPAVSVCMAFGGDRRYLPYEPTSLEFRGGCVAYALGAPNGRQATFLQSCLSPGFGSVRAGGGGSGYPNRR